MGNSSSSERFLIGVAVFFFFVVVGVLVWAYATGRIELGGGGGGGASPSKAPGASGPPGSDAPSGGGDDGGDGPIVVPPPGGDVTFPPVVVVPPSGPGDGGGGGGGGDEGGRPEGGQFVTGTGWTQGQLALILTLVFGALGLLFFGFYYRMRAMGWEPRVLAGKVIDKIAELNNNEQGQRVSMDKLPSERDLANIASSMRLFGSTTSRARRWAESEGKRLLRQLEDLKSDNDAHWNRQRVEALFTPQGAQERREMVL